MFYCFLFDTDMSSFYFNRKRKFIKKSMCQKVVHPKVFRSLEPLSWHAVQAEWKVVLNMLGFWPGRCMLPIAARGATASIIHDDHLPVFESLVTTSTMIIIQYPSMFLYVIVCMFSLCVDVLSLPLAWLKWQGYGTITFWEATTGAKFHLAQRWCGAHGPTMGDKWGHLFILKVPGGRMFYILHIYIYICIYTCNVNTRTHTYI